MNFLLLVIGDLAVTEKELELGENLLSSHSCVGSKIGAVVSPRRGMVWVVMVMIGGGSDSGGIADCDKFRVGETRSGMFGTSRAARSGEGVVSSEPLY